MKNNSFHRKSSKKEIDLKKHKNKKEILMFFPQGYKRFNAQRSYLKAILVGILLGGAFSFDCRGARSDENMSDIFEENKKFPKFITGQIDSKGVNSARLPFIIIATGGDGWTGNDLPAERTMKHEGWGSSDDITLIATGDDYVFAYGGPKLANKNTFTVSYNWAFDGKDPLVATKEGQKVAMIGISSGKRPSDSQDLPEGPIAFALRPGRPLALKALSQTDAHVSHHYEIEWGNQDSAKGFYKDGRQITLTKGSFPGTHGDAVFLWFDDKDETEAMLPAALTSVTPHKDKTFKMVLSIKGDPKVLSKRRVKSFLIVPRVSEGIKLGHGDKNIRSMESKP